MLNTQTQFGAFCVWVVIASICMWSAWNIFGISSPWLLWRRVFDSELAADLKGFQTLIGLPLGVLTLWIAFYLNRKLEIEKEEMRRDRIVLDRAHAICLELLDLKVECEFAVIDSLEVVDRLKGSSEANLRDDFKKAIRLQDLLIVTLSPEQLAILGFDAYAAARLMRASLRDLNYWVDYAPQGNVGSKELTAFMKKLVVRYSELALKSERCSELFRRIANSGSNANDLPIVRQPIKREIDDNVDAIKLRISRPSSA